VCVLLVLLETESLGRAVLEQERKCILALSRTGLTMHFMIHATFRRQLLLPTVPI